MKFELEIVRMDVSDVITASNDGDCPTALFPGDVFEG